MLKTQKEELKFDFSRIDTMWKCPFLYFLKYKKHLASSKGSTPLRFGSTYHAMQEGLNTILLEGGSISDGVQVGLELGEQIWLSESSLQEFPEDYRTLENCKKAFLHYVGDRDMLASLKELRVLETEEYMSYSVKTWSDIYTYLKPFTYEGIVDRKSIINNSLVIEDYKTTGSWISQAGKTYAETPQLTGYAWLHWKNGGEQAFKTIHDCMHVSKRVNLKLECFRFEHDISPREYELFEKFLLESVDMLCKFMYEERYPKNLNNCSNIFGTCEFCSFCKSDLEDYESFGYIVKKWDPSEKSSVLQEIKKKYFNKGEKKENA